MSRLGTILHRDDHAVRRTRQPRQQGGRAHRALAGRSRQRRPRRRRVRPAKARRSIATSAARSSPRSKTAIGGRAAMIANVGTNDVRSTIRAGKEAQACRRRRAARRRAAVRQADAGRDARVLRRGCRRDDAAGHRLQHPGAYGSEHAAGNVARARRAPRATSPASKNPAAISSRSRRSCATGRAGFTVWSGDDHLFLPSLAVGADGVVGVASHLCSREYRDDVRRIRARRRRRARRRFTTVCCDLIDALFTVTSPIAIKWAMGELGFNAGRCRLPLDRDSAVARRTLAPARRVVSHDRISALTVDSIEILGCRLDLLDPDEATDAILRFAREGAARRSSRSAPRWSSMRSTMPHFAHVVNASALSLCDTVGVLAVARRRGAKLHERVTGVELVERLCARAAHGRLPVYFFGGAEGVAADAAAILRCGFPDLIVAGTRNGFFSSEEERGDCRGDSQAAARASLFVGLGSPRQEMWLARNLRATGCGAGIGDRRIVRRDQRPRRSARR